MLNKKVTKVFKVAGAYIALLLLLEGAGQLAIRYLESKQPSGIEAEHLMSYREPVVGFGLKKGIDVKLNSWHVHTNRWGFRGEEDFPREKPANEKRIFLVGGSTVFGWGVNEDQTLASYFDILIEKAREQYRGSDTRIRVINAGVPWYASWHEAATIFFKVMEFSPDAIVILDGLNDTALGIASNWAPLAQGYVDTPTQLTYERKKQKETGDFLRGILRLSPTFSYFEARTRSKEAARVGTYRPEVWDQYLRIMNRVVTLTKAANIPVSFYYQPVQIIEKPITHYEQTHNGTSMATPEFAATFRQQYLDGEARVLASGLPVKSLKSIFQDNKKTIYLDGLHYNSLGNDIIAADIFEHSVKGWVTQWWRSAPRVAAK